MKAELTSQQIVTIVILIVSFSVILLFFFLLDFQGTIDEQSCRNSVTMRGAFSFFGQSIITLKCQTKDVCISFGEGCGKDFSVDALDIEVKSKGELNAEIGKLIQQCWWMMGEGNSKYSSDGCAICYNVKFGEDVKKEYESGQIPYLDIYNSMAVNKVSGSDANILFYLYKLNSVDSVRNEVSSNVNLDILSEQIDLSKNYAVVTSVDGSSFVPPVLVEFSGTSLKNKFKCSEYVTEI